MLLEMSSDLEIVSSAFCLYVDIADPHGLSIPRSFQLWHSVECTLFLQIWPFTSVLDGILSHLDP